MYSVVCACIVARIVSNSFVFDRIEPDFEERDGTPEQSDNIREDTDIYEGAVCPRLLSFMAGARIYEHNTRFSYNRPPLVLFSFSSK